MSILFLGAGLLFGACGDGGTSPPTSPPATPAPAPPPPPEPPPTPDGLGITSHGQDFIEWSWDPVEGASGYEVQIRANAAATDDDETIARTADETSYRGEDLESETPYYFRVRSFAGDGGDRLLSEWSAPTTAQIGRFVETLSLEAEETPDSDLSDLPPELAAKLQAFVEYVSVTAFTDRGLPDPAATPYTFGCQTPELQESQLQEWLNGILAFGLAAVDLIFTLFAEGPDMLDAKIAETQSILDGLLDGLATNLNEERCGLLHLGDTFVWQGEEDVISLTLDFPDGTTEQSPELGVIRVLGAAATLDPASASAEASPRWVLRDHTSLGGEFAPPFLSTPAFRLPREQRGNPY